jgi:hypothetical protein
MAVLMRALHHRGQENPNAKLTDAQAIELVRRIAAGERPKAVAESFGITLTTACQIYHGWRRPETRAAVKRALQTQGRMMKTEYDYDH